MKSNLLIEILIVLTGLLLVLAKSWISKYIFKRTNYTDAQDFEFIIFIIGCWIVFFAIALVIYHFFYFNPKYFKWIGLISGILLSFVNFYNWTKDYEKVSKDKYSGGPIGGLALGCFGILVFPLIGLGVGYLIKALI